LGRFFVGGKILPTQIPSFLANAITIRSVPGAPHDVDLDINVPAFKCAVFRHGLELLENKKYAEGEVAYRTLVELWPRDFLSHYNLACAESLLGHSDRATASLKRSVECGYNDLPHLLSDPDLDAIRSHPGYLAVVSGLQAQQAPVSISVPEPAAVEQEKLIVPEPEIKEEPIIVSAVPEVIAVVPVVSIPEPVEVKKEDPVEAQYQSELQLLADMGFGDRSKNLSLLVAENGDLANVIHLLFDN
jgi:hypothetical protein